MGLEPKSVILAAKTQNRRAFVAMALDRFGDALPEGLLLIKPNVVSHEPYPTTTHPDVLDAVLTELSGRKLMVADGAAVDLLRPGRVLAGHELARVCARHGLELINLHGRPMIGKKTRSGLPLVLSRLPDQAAGLISLPVLKSHKLCLMTGAMKNHFGLLPKKERARFHFHLGDIHQAIAGLVELAPASLYIVDAVVTSLHANEMRHGGVPTPLGYMLAGTDPVALDAFGLSLLAPVESRLHGLKALDLAYLRYASEWKLGRLDFEIEWIQLPGG